jgi:plasmid stabilization system protein ParE
MAHRVVWSPQALADVEAIAEYIEKDSPFYARAVVAKVVAAVPTSFRKECRGTVQDMQSCCRLRQKNV